MIAPVAIGLGGLAMIVLWVPFTLTHGPTSINEEGSIAGWDMHQWGFLLGVVPNLSIALGLVVVRDLFGDGRVRRTAHAVVVLALVASALMDLAFRALGPPFSLFLLVPATIALAATRPRRVAWAALAAAYTVALVLALVPLETSDSYDGYRLFGLAAHVLAGLAWIGVAFGGVRRGIRRGASVDPWPSAPAPP